MKATAEEVFEVATDFTAYPNGTHIKRVEIKERRRGPRHPGLLRGRREDQDRHLHARYDTDAPDSFSWDLVDGTVKELTGSYSFDEFDDVTEVQYETRIDPGFPLPGLLKRQAEKQIVRGALADLKKRVESG